MISIRATTISTPGWNQRIWGRLGSHSLGSQNYYGPFKMESTTAKLKNQTKPNQTKQKRWNGDETEMTTRRGGLQVCVSGNILAPFSSIAAAFINLLLLLLFLLPPLRVPYVLSAFFVALPYPPCRAFFFIKKKKKFFFKFLFLFI